MGNKNNLVSVRQSDFEVFQALAKDIEEGKDNEAKEYTQVSYIVKYLNIWRVIDLIDINLVRKYLWISRGRK